MYVPLYIFIYFIHLHRVQLDVSNEDHKCATGTQQQSIQKCKNIYFCRVGE